MTLDKNYFFNNRVAISMLVLALIANLVTTFSIKEALAADAVYSSASTYGSGTLPLTDNFNDNLINSYLWPTVGSSATTISETGGRIEITPLANTVGYASIGSRQVNFTNGTFEFDFVQTLGGPSGSGYNDQGLEIRLDSNNRILLSKGGGNGSQGSVAVVTGGVSNQSVFTDSTASQKYRVRMSGTTANFERWNGSSWTLFGIKTVSWNLSSITIALYAGYWGTGNANTQKGVFDNVVSSGITFGSNTATDADGNIYSTGTFTGTFDADPGAGTFNLVSAGGDDIYVRKLDSGGNFVWAKQFGSTGVDQGHYISIDGSDNIDVIGTFSGTVDFDPGAGTNNLTSATTDIFALELSQVSEATVTTSAASSVSETTTTFNGNVTSTGGLSVTERGFQYGLTTSYGTSSSDTGTFGTGTFNKAITGLTCNTIYHFRAFAINSQGTSYGSDLTFATSACPVFAPTVTTDAATNIVENSVTIAGNVTDTGGSDILDRGFDYGLTTTYTDVVGIVGSAGTGAFSADIENLECGTLYHFRAYAVNLQGTSYGSDNTFTTSTCPSTTTTGSVVQRVNDYSNFVGLQFPANYVPISASVGTPSNTTNPNTSQPLLTNNFQFLRNLDLGSVGEDVKKLQQFLNLNSFFVAQTGVGSVGQETAYFGALTKQAVKKFQEAFTQAILAPANLNVGTGFFGPSTRSFVNNLIH
jgi:hypothetical protein